MERLEAKVENHAERINKLEVRQAVAESNIDDLKDDIKMIKSDTRWTLRLIVGTIIAGVISYFFIF